MGLIAAARFAFGSGHRLTLPMDELPTDGIVPVTRRRREVSAGRHQCSSVAVGGVDRAARRVDRQWSDKRLIVFTEYANTKRYLRHALNAAIDGSDARSCASWSSTAACPTSSARP